MNKNKKYSQLKSHLKKTNNNKNVFVKTQKSLLKNKQIHNAKINKKIIHDNMSIKSFDMDMQTSMAILQSLSSLFR